MELFRSFRFIKGPLICFFEGWGGKKKVRIRRETDWERRASILGIWRAALVAGKCGRGQPDHEKKGRAVAVSFSKDFRCHLILCKYSHQVPGALWRDAGCVWKPPAHLLAILNVANSSYIFHPPLNIITNFTLCCLLGIAKLHDYQKSLHLSQFLTQIFLSVSGKKTVWIDFCVLHKNLCDLAFVTYWWGSVR